MKIQSVISPINFNGPKERPYTLISSEPQRDIFETSPFNQFQDMRRKFNVSDYLKMDEETKEKIRKTAGENDLYTADINVQLALDLKRGLDKTYGKNGYVFVSIGTSPSLIAKVMEFSGVEVKYLPMSMLAETQKDNSKFEDTNFSKYAKFLKSQGISFKDTVKSPKKYLFYDYCKTGTSLKKFREIIEKNTHVPKFKMQFKNLSEDLFATCSDEDMVIQYIDTYLEHSLASKYTSIRSLPYYQTQRAEYSKEYLTWHASDRAKLFDFLVADKLNKYHRLTENPKNANAL